MTLEPSAGPGGIEQVDFTRKPTLFVVATSHLDTQWRWTYQDTINRYIPATLRDNFALMEKYPRYVFSFEGAYRYMLAKEYYPGDFERLKEFVRRGQWSVCGSEIDAGDTNTVSPESLIRNVLYGNGFFRDELGTESKDIFLPDCFGFSWVLPTVASHCGLRGFSTSKLEWGSSVGIPFNVGVWKGVDGSRIVATINPGQYAFSIKEEDLANDEKWLTRIEETGKRCGAFVDFKYFGLGDVGGAPDEKSVKKLVHASESSGKLRVVSAPADALCRMLTEEQLDRLPEHNGEFLLIEHGAGTYTSHGAMKRWNRKNELLADAAERAAVAAEIVAGLPYPGKLLRSAWIRFLANQMHDILPGTCIPEAYHFAWNDETVANIQFGQVLSHAFSAVASQLDTNVPGIPIVVYNPLSIQRTDLVEIRIPASGASLPVVLDDTSKAIATQVIESDDTSMRIIFPATVGPVGWRVFEVRHSTDIPPTTGELKVGEGFLENSSYRVELDADGDICSIYDKQLQKELLAAPIRHEFLRQAPKEWPAWTITYQDVTAHPLEYFASPASIRIVERGPVRVALEVRREARGSIMTQHITLTCGGVNVHVETSISWASKGVMLKARFPLAAANPKATYDLGLGVIERGNNHERLYEVPAQQWAVIDDESDAFGIGVLTDCKYGWDKPDNNTLRLTLLHSPELTGFECHLGGAEYIDRFDEQAELDFGHHHFTYAITSHAEDWRQGSTPWKAARLNQPLIAAVAGSHAGPLGRQFSLLNELPAGIAAKALKKAESSDAYIVRLQELYGRGASIRVDELIPGQKGVNEVNGMEDPVPPAKPDIDTIEISKFQPRALAVEVPSRSAESAAFECASLDLPFNINGISNNENRMDGDIDGKGNSLPAELLPDEIESDGITFRIGQKGYRERNVVACQGQRLALPSSSYKSIHVLACSTEGDREATFRLGEESRRVIVPYYSGFLGQWDDRVENGIYTKRLEELKPAWRKSVHLAHLLTHRHSRGANADEAYVFCYLFRLGFAVNGATMLQLPEDSAIKILAVTAVRSEPFVSLQPDLSAYW